MTPSTTSSTTTPSTTASFFPFSSENSLFYQLSELLFCSEETIYTVTIYNKTTQVTNEPPHTETGRKGGRAHPLKE